LLHNPEYYLADAARRGVSLEDARVEFYGRARLAFEYFEEQVAAGALSWYGVSSNTIGSPSHDVDATSITRFIEAAEQAAPGGHHFRVVQLPLNLLEPGAVFERNTGPDNDRTVLEVAEAAGIAVLANRPLNAAGRSGLIRLAEVGGQDDAVDFGEQIRTVTDLEKAFREAIAPTLSAPQGAPEPSAYFDWAGQLEPLGAQSLTLEQWSHVAGQVQLGIARIARVLDRNLRGDIAQRWSSWRDRYFVEVGRLLGELRRQATERAARVVANVTASLDPLLPEDRRAESLSRKALWVVASTPGVTSVLNGMRAPDYVRDSLAVLEWMPHPSVREVYSALATHDFG
jgi:aryl-alcohol dehydrogenase-like predicted oxidoreductase